MIKCYLTTEQSHDLEQYIDFIIREYNPIFNRFHHCNFYYSEIVQIDDKEIILLKSYDTIVGYADLKDHTFTEIDKWSRTTSKQMTQCYNEIFPKFTRILVYRYAKR